MRKGAARTMKELQYQPEELVPIVAELAEKYTKFEHSSIPYEKAQELMEAVLYCIGELGQEHNNCVPSAVQENPLSAKHAYKLGKTLVLDKVEALRMQYNTLMENFCDYGSICLKETVCKGYPAFLKQYDPDFLPQETILTLDYPVLYDISGLCGIDAVYKHLKGIAYEQKFLSMFSKTYIFNILKIYHNDYEEYFENICEIVMMNIAGHLLQKRFCTENCKMLEGFLAETTKEELELHIETMFEHMLLEYQGRNNNTQKQIFHNQREKTDLLMYLKGGFLNIATRIYYGIQNKCLEQIFLL